MTKEEFMEELKKYAEPIDCDPDLLDDVDIRGIDELKKRVEQFIKNKIQEKRCNMDENLILCDLCKKYVDRNINGMQRTINGVTTCVCNNCPPDPGSNKKYRV